MPFLPISKEDMNERGIEQLDFICITGDSYVDHPSFGISIISRMIEDQGFTVGIIAQPDWKSDRDFKKLGAPRFAFLITGGNIDSMVAHYTSAKKKLMPIFAASAFSDLPASIAATTSFFVSVALIILAKANTSCVCNFRIITSYFKQH